MNFYYLKWHKCIETVIIGNVMILKSLNLFCTLFFNYISSCINHYYNKYDDTNLSVIRQYRLLISANYNIVQAIIFNRNADKELYIFN